jgi:hypothetical protein
MNYHLYLTLTPEALIASMLSPEEFAAYYAIGEHSKPSGQVMFIEVDPLFRSDQLQIEKGIARCVPSADGVPKSSVYISIYRVLEHIPLSALGDFYYVTRDGRALRTSKVSTDNGDNGLHLYYELAPVRPTVVSPLGPVDFKDLLVGQRGDFPSVPAIAFAELRLGELATNPQCGEVNDLPYDNIAHLRHCLTEVSTKFISTKMFDLSGSGIFSYRVIKGGVYVGNATDGIVLYPMPSMTELREKNYAWWRSIHV